MRVTCTVNGEQHQADDVWEGESLLYVLRERMGFPGSKNACEQGECGSCTIYLDGMLARSDAVLAVTPLSAPPRGRHGDPEMGEPPDVRWVVLHMIEETARHAGHLDIARELIDGQTGLGPR